jgi:starch-binding outer membrane protein, SusD/RagB family
MKNNNLLRKISIIGCMAFLGSCTDLKEEIKDGYAYNPETGGIVNTGSTLQAAYKGLRDFQAQGQMFALDEMSSDALVGPTRGGDWDDNASWRQIHTHTWGPDHGEVAGAWTSLLSNVYNCNLVIENGGTASEVLQARFLRAFYYYNVIDLFGQTPYREPNSSLTLDPKVRTRSEATTYVISELEAIVGSLPARNASDPSIANADAAHFLLAKMYLNKGVFDGTNAFSPGDMTKVVTNVDAMTNSLASDYWDNFKPTNNTSNELVFTSKNVSGDAGNIQSRWRMSAHYNETPGGWNGFSTLGEYYDRFDPNDRRIKNSDPAIIADFGNPAGFHIGQQYAPGGTILLRDRIDDPNSTTTPKEKQKLIFTKAVTMITGGETLESSGIRGLKYIPDNSNLNAPENDYVLMRYSDAMLMKAEAIARGGSGTAPDFTAYFARTGRPAVDLTNKDNIYAERGRELWWEGWRRNDMIRFGKFLNQRELKPYVSDNKFLLFPIPAGALLNPNIVQNPGY